MQKAKADNAVEDSIGEWQRGSAGAGGKHDTASGTGQALHGMVDTDERPGQRPCNWRAGSAADIEPRPDSEGLHLLAYAAP